MNGNAADYTQAEAQTRLQRWRSFAQDQCSLCAVSVYTQIYMGLSFYLYGNVSTAGSFSILLALPFLCLLLLPAFWIAGKARRGEKTLQASAGPLVSRAAFILFSLIHLFDAQLVFYAFCAILRNVMPEHHPLALAVTVVLVSAFALHGSHAFALPRLCRFLKWLIGGLLLYCMLVSIPHGQASHFFPVLGYGVHSIKNGALWMFGAVSLGVWPLLMPQEQEALAPVLENKGILIRRMFCSIAAGIITMLFSVWLMPVYAMSRPESLGWRLLLFTNMTPSIPAWSMQVIGLLFLFLLSLSYNISQISRITEDAVGKKPSLFFILVLYLALVPAGVLGQESTSKLLVSLAPIRAALAAAALLILGLGVAVKGRKKEGGPS